MLESEEDFEAAYELHASPIYNFFYWRTQDTQLAQDLTSSVFEKAWRSRSSFKGGSARAWLYRIAHNLLIDQWRTKAALPLVDEDVLVSDQPAVSEILDKQTAARRLYLALERLDVDMRAVVHLRFIENLPAKKVAKLLGLTESNVRVIQYRALKKLKVYLNEK